VVEATDLFVVKLCAPGGVTGEPLSKMPMSPKAAFTTRSVKPVPAVGLLVLESNPFSNKMTSVRSDTVVRDVVSVEIAASAPMFVV